MKVVEFPLGIVVHTRPSDTETAASRASLVRGAGPSPSERRSCHMVFQDTRKSSASLSGLPSQRTSIFTATVLMTPSPSSDA